MFDSVLKLRCSTIVAQLYTQPRGLLGQPGSMGCIPKCCEIATVFHICVKSEGWMLTLRLFDGVIPRFSGQTSDFLDKSIFSRTHPPTFWANCKTARDHWGTTWLTWCWPWWSTPWRCQTRSSTWPGSAQSSTKQGDCGDERRVCGWDRPGWRLYGG